MSNEDVFDNFKGQQGLGVVAQGAGDPQTALVHLQRAAEMTPEDEYTRYMIGRCYTDLDEYDKAIENYQHAIRLDPNDAFCHGFLAFAYHVTGQTGEALREADAAIKIDPECDVANFVAGICHLSAGDIDAALKNHEVLSRVHEEMASGLMDAINEAQDAPPPSPVKADVKGIGDEMIAMRGRLEEEGQSTLELAEMVRTISGLEGRLRGLGPEKDFAPVWAMLLDLKGDVIHRIGKRDFDDDKVFVGKTMRKVLYLGADAYKKSIAIKPLTRTYPKLANLYVFAGDIDNAKTTLNESLKYVDGSDRQRAHDRLEALDNGMCRMPQTYDCGLLSVLNDYEASKVLQEFVPADEPEPPAPEPPKPATTATVAPKAQSTESSKPKGGGCGASILMVVAGTAFLGVPGEQFVETSKMGIVKGRVFTRSGNPVPNATVRGVFSGLGGVITASTDREGRFVLNYSGVGSLDYVSVEGGDREDDVSSGSDLTLYKG